MPLLLCWFLWQSVLAQEQPQAGKKQTAELVAEIEQYLRETEKSYQPGDHEYYARLALDQAIEAYKEGNYGIGAVAVLVHGGKIYEFPNRNAMVTGLGVSDHAEARAITDAVRYRLEVLEGKNLPKSEQQRNAVVQPAKAYPRSLNDKTTKMNDGIYVWGTLEACPMCACMMLNAGVRGSVSTTEDGRIVEKNGQKVSDGGAMSIGDKWKMNPLVWQMIAQGQGLRFEILHTKDTKLCDLSRRAFYDTREAIDRDLATRLRRGD